MSNHAHRRRVSDLISNDPPLSRWQKTGYYLKWFFAPRKAPVAWRRRPYLRGGPIRPHRPPYREED